MGRLEDKLQSDVVRTWSELHPYKRKNLFHVANERLNKVQAFKSVSMGIVSGVSDLIYIDKNYVCGIELKVKGSRHKRRQLELQTEWGELLESCGFSWRMVTNVDDAISCCEGVLKGLTTKDVREILKKTKTLTLQI